MQTTASLAGAFIVAPSEAIAKAAQSSSVAGLKQIAPPKGRAIKVAFLISEPVQVIDFTGPWEIFSQAMDPARELPAFDLYTVTRKKSTIKATGGLKIVPDYTFANAPTPDIVVVPAQGDDSEAVMTWLRKVTEHTQVTMSVCTGAFLLAKAGLLDGLEATTFHDAYKLMTVDHPKVKLKRQVRFVDNGHLATSSGLSAGIDLALHIVARYFGEAVADETAATLEYAVRVPKEFGHRFQNNSATHSNGKRPRALANKWLLVMGV